MGMTIDEAIESLKSDYEIDMYIRDIAPQLAEWLEELKKLKQEKEQDIYERAYAEGRDKGYSCGEFNGYNKAIDEACLKIYNYLLSENDFDRLFCEDWEALAEAFKEIAEELKAGGEDAQA